MKNLFPNLRSTKSVGLMLSVALISLAILSLFAVYSPQLALADPSCPSGEIYGNPFGAGHPSECYKPGSSGTGCSSNQQDNCTEDNCEPSGGVWGNPYGAGHPEVCSFPTTTPSTGTGITNVPISADQFGLPHASADNNAIQSVLQIVFGIAGALALLMIVISGFRYITSAGNPQATAKAKNGIVYSAIGLLVCVLAEALVTFVVGHV